MKRIFLLPWILCLVMFLQAAPPAKIPGRVRARLLGERPLAEGILQRVDDTGWTIGEGAAIPDGSILAVYVEGASALPSQRPEICFANGDRLRASVKGAATKGDREILQVETTAGALIDLDLERIQGILFWSRLSALPRDEQDRIVEKVLAEKPDFEKDLLAVDLGEGTVDLDGSGYLSGEILKAGAVTREVPDPDNAEETKTIQAGLLAGRLKFPAAAPGLPGGAAPAAVLALADGGVLTGRARALTEHALDEKGERKEKRLSFETVHGFALEIPLLSVRQLDFLHDALAPLSGLKPSRTEFRRLVTGEGEKAVDRLWPHLAEDRPAAPQDANARTLKLRGLSYRRGLGTHAHCRVAYEIPAGFSRFVADVGVDDHVAHESSPDAAGVIARVYGDGKLLYESPLLTVRSDPAFLSVPVTGVKVLELETAWGTFKDTETLLAANPPLSQEEFLKQTDILDRACWGHAVLVK